MNSSAKGTAAKSQIEFAESCLLAGKCDEANIYAEIVIVTPYGSSFFRARAFSVRAATKEVAGDCKGAIEDLSSAIREFSETECAEVATARVLRGKLNGLRSQYQDAQEDFDYVINHYRNQLPSQVAEALLLRCAVFVDQKSLEDALRDAREAAAIVGASPTTRGYALQQCYGILSDLNRVEEAKMFMAQLAYKTSDAPVELLVNAAFQLGNL